MVQHASFPREYIALPYPHQYNTNPSNTTPSLYPRYSTPPGGMVGAFSGLTNNNQGSGPGSNHESETIHGGHGDDSQYYNNQSQSQAQSHAQTQSHAQQAYPNPSRSPRNYDHDDRNNNSSSGGGGGGYHHNHNLHPYRDNDEREHKSGNQSGGGSVNSHGSNRDARDHMRRSNRWANPPSTISTYPIHIPY